MPESLVQVTQGVGPKLHAYQRTIGANAVEDEVVIPGEHYLPSYFAQAVGISAATTGDHVLQICSAASLIIRIRRIYVEQQALITAAAHIILAVNRVTTAGTGGTAIIPAPFDTGDAASSATNVRALTSPKGTLGVELFRRRIQAVQTSPVGGLSSIPSWEWHPTPGTKPLIIPAGTANGIVLQVGATATGATVDVTVEWTETAWL